jgi:type I restriction enzyme M protein
VGGGVGQKISRTQIELTDEEIERISSTYHAWRGTLSGAEYADVGGARSLR